MLLRGVSVLYTHSRRNNTIYDNLLLNHRNIPNKVIMAELKYFDLLEKVLHQPNGLKTIIYEWKTVFTQYELTQLMFIRALLIQPQLLVIDRALDIFNDEQVEKLIARLLELSKTILIVISQKNNFKYITNHLVIPS